MAEAERNDEEQEQQHAQHNNNAAAVLPIPAQQALHADYPHNAFAFEAHLQGGSTALKLSTDVQLCPAHLAHLQDPSIHAACPLGSSCPLRHGPGGALNFRPPARDPHKRTVCKHWLRGLCKKGDTCDYLHEYDMRRMPECRFFATFGFCNSADDCLYLHVDAKSKRRPCERYERGFCPYGPKCPKKHVRRPLCPRYVAGFCPSGKECKLGHAKAVQPSAASRQSSPILTHRPMTIEEAFGQRDTERRYGGSAPAPGGGDGGGGGGYGGGQQRREGAGGQRYQDRGGQRDGGQQGGGGGGGGKRDLATVLCFKCGEYGHFANACPNPAVPGDRGGQQKGAGGRPRGGGQGGGQY